MYKKDREKLLEILKDMEDFAEMKGIIYPPVYMLGGSGCIMAGYLNRGTTDFDLLDMEYAASMGRLLRILEKVDLLDLYLTTIPEDFQKRVVKLKGYKNIYVLSKEDIIVSKIGRYSLIDVEDISILIQEANIELLNKLIQAVINRDNISKRIKKEFELNLVKFRADFNV